MMKELVQEREGMIVRFNVSIEANDGLELRANIYTPKESGKYPVVLSYGVYGKDLHVEKIYKSAWESIVKDNPEVLVGSTNIHQVWELVDPEKWCPDGYVCVRVDSRGAGNSPGYCDPWGEREAQDIYDCIEWCAQQEWCNGKIGMCGISYFSVNAWQVAELQPPHLAAIIAWEGFNDIYRECTHNGGIVNMMMQSWEQLQVIPLQYGLGDNGYKSRVTGFNVSSDVNMTARELVNNREDFSWYHLANHPLLDDFARAHSTKDLSKVVCPVLSAANWGGLALHLRGNIEGFMRAGSEEKFLEVHGLDHFSLFYSTYGMNLQKQFFGHYLKGEDTGWLKRRKVQLQIRHVDKFVERFEDEFPLARTQYTRFYLDPKFYTLSTQSQIDAGTITYRGMGDGVMFLTLPFEEETEITGYVMAKLFVSSSTRRCRSFPCSPAVYPRSCRGDVPWRERPEQPGCHGMAARFPPQA